MEKYMLGRWRHEREYRETVDERRRVSCIHGRKEPGKHIGIDFRLDKKKMSRKIFINKPQ